MGDHAGMGLIAEQLNTYSRTVGNASVIAVGNEGDTRHHFSSSLEANTMYRDTEIRVGENERGFLLELWGRGPEIFSVSFISPAGEVVPRIPARIGTSQRLSFLFEETVIFLDYRTVEIRSGFEIVIMRFSKPTPGVWTVRVYGTGINLGQYHIYLPIEEFLSSETYFLRPDPDTTLTVPSSAPLPITVSAYDNTTGSIYAKSGRGFTILEGIKPDLAAPGVNILGPDLKGGYVRRSGTSIAAAITSGVCAQMLTWGIEQENAPGINSLSIKANLIRGAKRESSITYPDKAWGYGKLNAYNIFETLRSG